LQSVQSFFGEIAEEPVLAVYARQAVLNDVKVVSRTHWERPLFLILGPVTA
jgi:hypothetical protein